MSSDGLTKPAKLLLLAALLAKDRIVSSNGKCFLKELVLRRDNRLGDILTMFEDRKSDDADFLESIHKIIEEESELVYNDLFSDTSLEVGKMLSKSERESKCLNLEKSLIYGEVDFHSFYAILRKINPIPGSTFYDLGSGTGKAVFVARITQDFARCIGIEILESLHDQAVEIVESFNKSYRKNLCSGQNQHASVYVGSFLEFDWSDGDVVFANSTCFDDELMQSMGQAAEALKPGAILVSFTKGITSEKFEVLYKKRYRMSWGPATDGSSCELHRLVNVPSTDSEDLDDRAKEFTDGDDSKSASSYENDGIDEDDSDDFADDDGDEEESGSDDESTEETGDEDDQSDEGTTPSGSSEDEYSPENVYEGADYGRKYTTDFLQLSANHSNSNTSTPTRSPQPDYSENALNSPQDSALLRQKRAVLGSREKTGQSLKSHIQFFQQRRSQTCRMAGLDVRSVARKYNP